MKKLIFINLLLLITSLAFAQTKIATTEDGEKVLLKDDKTWEYLNPETKEIDCRNSVSIIYEKYGADSLVNLLNNEKEDWGRSFTCRNSAMHFLRDLYEIPTELLLNSLNTFGRGGRILICGVFERKRDAKTDSLASLKMAELIVKDPDQTVKSWAAMALQELNYDNDVTVINDALIEGLIKGSPSSTSYQCAKALSNKKLTRGQENLIYRKVRNKNLNAIYYIQFRYHYSYSEKDKKLILNFLSDDDVQFLEEFLDQMRYTYRPYSDKQIIEKLTILTKHKSPTISKKANEILEKK